MYIKYDSLIIFSRGWSQSNGRVRTEKYKIVFLQNERFTMIHSAFKKAAELFHFHHPSFLWLRHPCLIPTICVRASWGLEYSWGFLFLLAQSILFSPQHEGGALWQLNPTLASISSTCLTPFFHFFHCMFLLAFIYIYTYAFTVNVRKGKRLITVRMASIIQAKNQRHFVLKTSEMPREGAF